MMERIKGMEKMRSDTVGHPVTFFNGASRSVSCGRRGRERAGGARNPHKLDVLSLSMHIREIIKTRATLLLCFMSTITYRIKRFKKINGVMQGIISKWILK